MSYINSGLIGAKMHRAKAGVDEVMGALSANVSTVHLASPISKVTRFKDGVEIETESAQRERFDHVVTRGQPLRPNSSTITTEIWRPLGALDRPLSKPFTGVRDPSLRSCVSC